MAQFTLGTASFATSPERDRFMDLRRKYLKLGIYHQKAFNACYTKFTSADDLFRQFPDDLERALSETVAKVADDLAANQVFDVSQKTIRAELEARAETVADGFNRVRDRYLDIIGKSAELEAQRQEARDNRGRIMGGGFGVEGAARGMAIAAIANAAIGMTYGLANLTAKAASDLGDKQQKREMLSDPSTKAAPGNFLRRIALEGGEYVAEVVNKAKGNVIFDRVSADAHYKSAAMIENVIARRVPEADAQAVLVQALELDPFNGQAWQTWLDRYGDQDGSVGASAKAFGVDDDVNAHKSKLIAERKAELSWETPEECRANSVILEQNAQRLGFPFDPERSLIEARAVKLDRERRTFNGKEYPSLADATTARQTHEDKVQRTVAGVVHDTHDGANEARALIREQTIFASSASGLFGWLTLSYRRCFQMKGRSSRKEFWMFVLSMVGAIFILLAAINLMNIPKGGSLPVTVGISLSLYLLGAAISLLTVQVRRFHDLDLSGWLVLLNAIPYVGWAIVLLFMLAGGTRGDNRFGPDPRER